MRNEHPVLGVITSTSLKGFYEGVDQIPRCFRCNMPVRDGDNVAAFGQVTRPASGPMKNRHQIVGGLLCESCSGDWGRFLNTWMVPTKEEP